MPEIKLKHVVSCSSEDNTHKADNLLSSDTYRKWKAARPGEKHVSVILQLEKEEQIHSIDIGNEGSAFIEVLVGHSTSVKDQDFEVFLVTSSFMSPTESRNGTNTSRVRFFGPSQLVKATAQEKWDRVKIVCSQPYSKCTVFGVSFIKLQSPPDADDAPVSTPPKLTKLGQFRVKDESPSSGSSVQPGSLFFSRDGGTAKTSTGLKVSPQNVRLSYAAAALKSEGSSTPSSSSSSQQAPVKRKFEFSKECLEAAGPPPKKPSSSGSSEANSATPKSKARTGATARPVSSASPAQRTSDKRESPKSKPEPKPKPKAKSAEPVPFNRIMEGVVFVLSGFQNPLRGELRDKALALGARYRPDWTPDSTHLICAFANTPKYSQVKAAGGVIVRKEWVMDCHKTKRKSSFKRYLMNGAESSSETEAEEDESEEETQKAKTPEKRQLNPKKQAIKEEEEEYGGSTDAEDPEGDASGMDTEDELNRVKMESRRKKAAKKSTVQMKDEDLYGGSTDENTDAEEEEDKPIPELPDFLTGKRFYLYGKFPDNQKRQLQRYIIAFNGAVEDYMSKKVQFVVTSEGWDESFEDRSVRYFIRLSKAYSSGDR
ncbi:DNA repair protein XRCC1-like [Sinocyclocheilus anshuiensis]|uniref:DNA repair protein XRCC1-like n=1 Tax=Sinocyclocheilus anshuiensis TaxID=1608454 RepID=UPI0007B84642|nr:PREDICTED: DNA repair protein XRCC1-like [Sinocyclocheilus anshuiensis]